MVSTAFCRVCSARVPTLVDANGLTVYVRAYLLGLGVELGLG